MVTEYRCILVSREFMSFLPSFIRRIINPTSWVGRRVHARFCGHRIEGEVVEEIIRAGGIQLVLDAGECRAFVSVWKHDARPLREELPVEAKVI